jgi:hypothetical protein
MSHRDGIRWGTEKNKPTRYGVKYHCSVWIFSVSLCLCGSGFAAPPDPGRLFYTPAQRAQLEAARARNITQLKPGSPESGPPPQRFDGIVVRSDGSTTRWVNGQPQAGAAGVAGLKPGQIRADGRVYEPYQVLRPRSPEPASPDTKEPAP